MATVHANFNWRRRSSAMLWPVAAACLALGACQQNPETATVAVQPQTAPVRTITSFDEPLRCMDNMLWAQGKKDVYITSAGIPDATGQVAAGTKEMLITALSKMSAKSGAFRFVDYDPTQIDVQALSELVGLRQGFVAPSYYIRGAITQLDSAVLSSQESAGVSLPFADLGISRDQVASVISVDLNMGQLTTRQILPGMSASNSMTVVRAGRGADAGGVIGKAGLTLSVSFDRSEGLHQAVRNLIELSAIELVGKLTRVPYWQCLKVDQANPTFRAEAREWYDTMGEAERARFVTASLARAGYWSGTTTGADDPQLHEAIARYQANNDLVPNGRIDFDLYYRLIGANAVASGIPGHVQAAARLPDAPTPPPRPASPPQIALDTNRGPRPAYRVNEDLVVRAQPNQDAFLYCYYQDAAGEVARIFPNRFQPDAFVRAGRLVNIPPGDPGPFQIRFDRAGSREMVACLASDLELGLKLPETFKANDLEPLPVASIDAVVDRFTQLGRNHVSVNRLPIEVVH